MNYTSIKNSAFNGGIKLPDFRLYCKANSNQNRMLLALKQKYRWNRIKSRQINPHTHGQLIYDKGRKLYNGEKTVSSVSGAKKTGQLQENYQMKTQAEHSDINCSNIFLDTPSRVMGFPGGSAGKEFAYNAGDLDSIPGL